MGSTGAARGMRSSGNTPTGAGVTFDASTASLRDLKMHIAENFDRVDVEVRDKWGDYLKTDSGFTDGTGRLFAVNLTGRTLSGAEVFRVDIGDTTRGFVAANYGLSEQEAWNRLYEYLMKRR